MKVLLANRGNPDRDENHMRRLAHTPADCWAEACDFADASRICREYIEANHLGSGNWTGGAIMDEGEVVGRVSYNGKVWPDVPWSRDVEPLYDPAAVGRAPGL